MNFWLTKDAVLRYKQRHPEVTAGMRELVRERVVKRDVVGEEDVEAGVLVIGPLKHATTWQVCSGHH